MGTRVCRPSSALESSFVIAATPTLPVGVDGVVAKTVALPATPPSEALPSRGSRPAAARPQSAPPSAAARRASLPGRDIPNFTTQTYVALAAPRQAQAVQHNGATPSADDDNRQRHGESRGAMARSLLGRSSGDWAAGLRS